MFKPLIVLAVLMFGLTVAQEITLKKLYDGIEDLRLEYKMRNVQPSPNANEKDSKELTAILIKNHVKTNQTCGEETVPIAVDDVHVIAKIAGSFTKPRVQQTLYVYSTCTYAFGLAILELGKPIAVYDSGLYYNAFTVKDINENGLNEVMLEVQSKAKDAWGEMHAVHLLEFKDAKPTSLGSFFIGGP